MRVRRNRDAERLAKWPTSYMLFVIIGADRRDTAAEETLLTSTRDPIVVASAVRTPLGPLSG